MNDCHSRIEMTPRSARSNSEGEQDTKCVGESDLEYCCKITTVSRLCEFGEQFSLLTGNTLLLCDASEDITEV